MNQNGESGMKTVFNMIGGKWSSVLNLCLGRLQGCMYFKKHNKYLYKEFEITVHMEQNKWLLDLQNFTRHCLKNPEILLVTLC